MLEHHCLLVELAINYNKCILFIKIGVKCMPNMKQIEGLLMFVETPDVKLNLTWGENPLLRR